MQCVMFTRTHVLFLSPPSSACTWGFFPPFLKKKKKKHQHLFSVKSTRFSKWFKLESNTHLANRRSHANTLTAARRKSGFGFEARSETGCIVSCFLNGPKLKTHGSFETSLVRHLRILDKDESIGTLGRVGEHRATLCDVPLAL